MRRRAGRQARPLSERLNMYLPDKGRSQHEARLFSTNASRRQHACHPLPSHGLNGRVQARACILNRPREAQGRAPGQDDRKTQYAPVKHALTLVVIRSNENDRTTHREPEGQDALVEEGLRLRHRRPRQLTYANIPFADPSAIPGGMRFLLALWDVGILRFEPATAEEIDLARRNPDTVLPGTPPALPAPFCWGPFGRNDIGLGRLRPKTNPLGLPLRRPKTGPKTPKLLLDSDVDDDEIAETEVET